MLQPPFGSTLNNPGVRRAMQALAEAAASGHESASGADRRARPDGSYFQHPAVVQRLQALGEHQAQAGCLFVVKNVLNGGEISPHMGARFDQPRCQTGNEYLLNMIPLPQGGLTKRPGMKHMGEPLHTQAVRLVPFVFSSRESRILEFSGTADRLTMRVWMPDGTLAGAPFMLNLPGWTGNDLEGMSFAQSADVIFLAHTAHVPAKISRYGDTDWRYEIINWMPSIASPVIILAGTVGSIPSGENSRTSYSYVATVIDAETGEESMASGAVTVENAAPLTQTYYVAVTIQAVEQASEYRVYKKKGGVYGYIGRVLQPEDGENPVFEDRNMGADTEDTPPNARNPFHEPGLYPGVVFLHQQRLGYAASLYQPLTIWLSQAGNFESMAASIPPADDDAIEVTLAATQANRILWCQSDRNTLAVGTEGGEWILSGTEGGALTPSDLSFQPQTYHGSQGGLPVLRAGNALLYLQRGGRVVREYGYTFSADRYESSDLSLLARHMLRDSPVKAWAWQGEPYSVVWCVLESGELVGLTYMREHDVVGWHRHETAGQVRDVTAIPGEDGNHQVWLVVERNGGMRIETLAPFFEGGDPALAVHTDGREKATFAARCVPCLPESSLENGSTFLRIRKLNAIKCRVLHSRPFLARVGDGPALPVPVRGADYAVVADWALPLGAGWRDGDRLELIFDGPEPVTLLGMVIVVELAELAGGQH